jgi:hypothetical protein
MGRSRFIPTILTLALAAVAPGASVHFDQAHDTLWGGSAIHGEDYGVAW